MVKNENESGFKVEELFMVHSSPLEIYDYFYPQIGVRKTSDQFTQTTRDLNPEVVSQIRQKLGLRFIIGDEDDVSDENASPVCYANSSEVTQEFRIELPPQSFKPVDLLNYIYAVFYSPAYREKYKDVSKTDFPEVPYPLSQFSFWKLVKLGDELRKIHLLECTVVNKLITKYPVEGNNRVGKIHFEDNRVYINYDPSSTSGIEALQYFENVPEKAWEFYMGDYQPAQKWLTDRTGTELSSDDIVQYQKIIVALTETIRIMKEIDGIRIW